MALSEATVNAHAWQIKLQKFPQHGSLVASQLLLLKGPNKYDFWRLLILNLELFAARIWLARTRNVNSAWHGNPALYLNFP